MKKLVSLLAITVAVMLVALPVVYGQGQARPQQQQQADKTFEGQLTKVDAQAKTISVKGAAGEMMFHYTEQTRVVGGEKDVQGLAAKNGAPLRISYQDQGANHVATTIEVAEKEQKK